MPDSATDSRLPDGAGSKPVAANVPPLPMPPGRLAAGTNHGEESTSKSWGPDSAAQWIAIAALVVAVFAVYIPCWHGGWLWDDDLHLLNNPVLRPGGLLKCWIPGGYLNYWPLTFTAYWAEFQLWGLRPLGFHLVNIALHALAAVLVWRLLVRLKVPGALLAAGIFALHPVNVESVAWVAQLKDVLSLVLALASALFYLAFEEKSGRWRYILAIVAFALSALAKGEVLTLPLVLLALAWWRKSPSPLAGEGIGVRGNPRRIDRKDVLRVLPYFLIAACMSGFEFFGQRSLGSELVRADGIFSRTAIAGCAVWFYLWKFIWPLHLTPMYPRWPLPAGAIWYLPTLALVAAFGIAWWKRRTWGRPVLIAMFCYIALLLPVLGFVNIFFMRYALVADHWQYPATIVLAAAVGAAFAMVARRWLPAAAVWAAGLVLLLLLSDLTWPQAGIYIDADTFLKTCIARNPDAWLAENNLGSAFGQRGDFDSAIGHFRRAVELNPEYSEAHSNLAVALVHSGQIDLALAEFDLALKFKPTARGVDYSIALLLANRGDLDSAIEHLHRQLQTEPNFGPARELLAQVVSDRQRLANFLEHARQQLNRQPNNVALLDSVASVLATNPNASFRDGREAVRLAERASKIMDSRDPRTLDTLAAAYAEAGRFSDAVLVANAAVRLATSQADEDRFRAHLSLFQNREPLHQSPGP